MKTPYVSPIAIVEHFLITFAMVLSIEVIQGDEVKLLEGAHLRKVSTWSDRTQRIERFRYRDGLIYTINGFKLQIIDVHDWQNPEMLSELELPRVISESQFFTALAFKDIEIVKNYGYIVQAERYHGIRPAKVIDLSDPSSPVELPDTPMEVLAMTYDGRYAAISAPQDLIILEPDDEGNLAERSRIAFLEMRHGIPAPQVEISDAFAVSIIDGTPLVVDFTKPQELRFLRDLTIHGSIALDGTTVFATGEAGDYSGNSVSIWKLDNDAEQSLCDLIELPGTKHVSRPHVYGNVLYCFRDSRATADRILAAYDVSDTENIIELGTLTFPASRVTGRSRWIAPAEDHLIVGIDGELHIYEILNGESVEGFAKAYESWSARNLGATTPEHQLPEADPDSDGSSNIIEMATGGDPLVANAPVRVSKTERGLEVTFSRDLRYATLFEVAVEVSPNLLPQNWVQPSEAKPISTELDGIGLETVSLSPGYPFARLRVGVVEP